MHAGRIKRSESETAVPRATQTISAYAASKGVHGFAKWLAGVIRTLDHARFLNRRPEQTKAPTQNCFPKVLKDLLGHDREHTDFPFAVILSGSREEANLVIDPLEVGLVPSEYHMAISSLLSAQTRTGLEMMEDDGAFEGRDLGAAHSPR
ncbi:nonsense-mediated mRNA decay factor (Upf2) [Fusarium sp. NRRL 25303]|nr:nonsense-mediated mRNA decay factor (Upf2) [Fusarium sp. NRRL 25303]